MVMANNHAYSYEDEYLNQEPIKKPNQKKKQKKQQKASPHIFSIVLIFGISVLLISRYAITAEINFSLNQLNKEYKNVLKENADLNVELMKTVNLEALEKNATERLGMNYPNSDQYVYVNVSAALANTDNQKQDYYGIEDVQENKYITKTKNIINTVMKFLD